jgi:uncharacterized protein (TIGR03067 family)
MIGSILFGLMLLLGCGSESPRERKARAEAEAERRAEEFWRKEESRPDKERLQGTWIVVPTGFPPWFDFPGGVSASITFTGDDFRVQQTGLTLPAPGVGPDGDKPSVISKGRDLRGTFRVSPEAEPKAIDFVTAEGGKQQTLLGIYRVKRGYGLEIAISDVEGRRPTEFRSDNEKSVCVISGHLKLAK